MPAPLRSGAHECKQVLVEGVGIDLGEAVAAALVDLQLRALDDLRRRLGRSRDRHDLVVIAVYD
jgi:hypothetical protein